MHAPFAVSLLLVATAIGLAACAPEREAEAPGTDAPEGDGRIERVGEAVIYEVFVRSFTPEGTFRAMIPRLDSLRALGVTTVWLMPIHPVGEANRKGRLGSPYAVRDYRAVDPAFGTLADFRALVAAVHARGMTIILDLVANHTAWDHPWVRQHPVFYTRAADGAVPTPPEGTDWTDVADLDYASATLRDSMRTTMRYWVEEFDVDGYRCDVAELVPADFWREAIAELRAIKPVLMLAEGQEPWLHEAGFDVTYAWNTYDALKKVWAGASGDSLYAALFAERATYPAGALRLRFVTNHDETSWDDAAVRRFNGVDGLKAASVVAFTLPGIPLLYNGQEVAAPQRMNLFEDEKVDWRLNPDLRRFYQTLLGVRAASPALREGTFEPIAHASGADVLVYARQHEGERVLVVVNARAEPRRVTVPGGALGPAMQDVFGEANPDSTLALGPYGFRLFRGMAR